MFRILATPAARHARPIRLFHRLWRLLALRRQRHALAQLDAHLLRDIGLTSDAAQREASRPLWDVPAHWRS